jgi:hypothetical protein
MVGGAAARRLEQPRDSGQEQHEQTQGGAGAAALPASACHPDRLYAMLDSWAVATPCMSWASTSIQPKAHPLTDCRNVSSMETSAHDARA